MSCHPWIPGPGDVNPRPQPGAFLDRSGRSIAEMLTSEDPEQHPEWFNRDARLPVMDAQGVEACWMFPSQGVCMEGPMQPDIDAILDVFRAFNRWLDDEWGFAYKERIFSAPYLTLSGLDNAISELEWVLERGARIIAVRPGPVFVPDGWKSPADPMFDPFWARVAEARLIVAVHPGFDDGYRDVENAVARSWGYESRRRQGSVSSLNFYEPIVGALMSHRLIQDFMVVITAHGIFERHPRLRFGSIENGVAWVPGTLKALRAPLRRRRSRPRRAVPRARVGDPVHRRRCSGPHRPRAGRADPVRLRLPRMPKVSPSPSSSSRCSKACPRTSNDASCATTPGS